MNRAFNKTVAFAFFFLVYSLNPLEFQIMQQRTVLNILDLVWPLLRYSELEW